MAFREISPYELQGNLFHMIDKEWALITAEADGKANAMTINWGGFGNLWNQLVTFVFVRPQRYTFDFTEASDYYSVSFYDPSYRKELSYFGTVSGREEDKFEKTGFHLTHEDGIPFPEEANVVLLCKKFYGQFLTEDSFVDKEVMNKAYPLKDFHKMYVGGIVKVLVRE